MRILRSFFLLACLLVVAVGCGPSYLGEELTEGYIKYDITYPNPGDKEDMVGILPDKMTLTFKDNQIRTDLKAGFGMFSLTSISHVPNSQLTHLCRIITNKYVVDLDQGGANEMLKLFPKYTIEYLEETKEIAGYTCNAALFTDVESPETTFKVFYTKKIHVDQPNWFTPFHQIDGMMMEYEIKKFNMQMKLTADKVVGDSISSDNFQRPGGYTPIDYPALEGKLEMMMETN